MKTRRQVRVTLVQSTNGENERYVKLCTEVIDDGMRVSVSRIDLSVEDLGSLLCGLVVETEEVTETKA